MSPVRDMFQKWAQETALPTNEKVDVPPVVRNPEDKPSNPRSWGGPGDPDDHPVGNRPAEATLSDPAEEKVRKGKEGFLMRYLAMGRKPMRDEDAVDLHANIKARVGGAVEDALEKQEKVRRVGPTIHDSDGSMKKQASGPIDPVEARYPYIRANLDRIFR